MVGLNMDKSIRWLKY